jgi:prolyl-tRNA synthetase
MTTTIDNENAESITQMIKAKGDEIRELKAKSTSKEDLMPFITELQSLKKQYEDVAGKPYDTPKPGKPAKKTKVVETASEKKESADSFTITPRLTDYSAWYNDVIKASDMIASSPVRGCMVIKPWGMAVWDFIREEFDRKIKSDMEANNAYFPIFIPKSFLAKEAEHVDGFAKECAVVTHHRLCASPDGKDLIPDPEAELEDPLVVRPTSETVIWHMFGQWIESYRDLPLKINQWANVVRWELRTRPFLRSAEFLWQEGHTAHATKECAVGCARQALDMYHEVCENLLAVPTVRGRKSPSERFAGADDTYTIEALMQNGWALQSGTSHFLGQNFAKAFDVFFQAESGNRELVWATSWGVSTRLMGAMVMTHSDDRGLVLPPRVAPQQVVIVPIGKGKGPDHETVMARAKEIQSALKSKGIRVKIDDRENMRPGAKYFDWERKGLPVRLDIGPRDVASNVVIATTRNKAGEKTTLSSEDDIASTVQGLLDTLHDELLAGARDRLKAKTYPVSDYATMKTMIEKGGEGDIDSAGFYLVPWKCDADNEEAIKQDCKATIRCYPLDLNQSPPTDGTKCFYSGDQATHMAIFARAF